MKYKQEDFYLILADIYGEIILFSFSKRNECISK